MRFRCLVFHSSELQEGLQDSKGEERMSLELVLGETGIALMALLAGGLAAAIVFAILEYVSRIL